MKKSKKYKNLHENIISECKKGNRKAQFEIYNLYYKSMYNASLRIVKNSAEAEDIMQDAFLKAFQNLGYYKEEVSFGAWLKRIVVNQSIDHLRKRKIEIIPIENELTEKPVNETDADSEIDDKTKYEEVLSEISKLPEGYRIIITLYLLEGYDHNEIAEILKISSSTSRSQYLRARKKLVENINAHNKNFKK